MAVPKYDQMYEDYLRVLEDGRERSNPEIRTVIAQVRALSEEDLAETFTSGEQVFRNRVAWTCEFLLKAGLIQRVRRGVYAITAEGQKALREHPGHIDTALLRRYPSFRAWDAPAKKAAQKEKPEIAARSDATPEEAIEAAFREVNDALAEQLMAEIMAQDPAFFERMVVRLLLKMGYSSTGDGHVTAYSGDGGIDGIISEDRLGLSRLYLQAKRWAPDQTVGRPEIQKFSGALRDVGGTKGLFITTARFSKEAQESARRQNIVLVDGGQLTRLMIEYGLGVSTVATYEIKRLDSDFFNDEE